MHDYSKGIKGGVQPPIIRRIEGWTVGGGARRLSAWEGMLFHLRGQQGVVYDEPFGEALKVPANQEGIRRVAHDHLWRLQHPPSCADAHVLIYSFRESYAGAAPSFLATSDPQPPSTPNPEEPNP